MGIKLMASTPLPQISQRLPKIPRILNLDPQILLMALILPRQIARVLTVLHPPAHPYSRLHWQIEWKLVGVCVSM